MINQINQYSSEQYKNELTSMKRNPYQIKNIQDASVQVEFSNTQLMKIVDEIDKIHQQEKNALLEQINYLEKKLQQTKAKQLIQSINEVKNIYLNQIEINKPTRMALDSLEQLINEKQHYEVSDLKYRLHQAEKVLKLPMTEFKTYPVEKLANSIKKCQQFESENTNLANILEELNQADDQWNQISKDLYDESSTLINSIQSTTQNIIYELSLLDCNK
ncbi:unnamed protein product (macronuclear) [Paramecium tetraurelia]|uniref:Nucleoporin Nup54 alpha-helical domain-containing protein n=1 Tax=Paramecium tetraurelia TaxID=5888 RepID=A0C5A3_PARTE|nr:uncharacterized protein GSPATT00006469001 [Paramecium tetraurelia]CAK65970.1 unnamed protein product [Paramecium tetraurelia]|eukprot:XP_001433367.1 hypothetical protein (macronuclear) [Paramecium tetraurelia strain d4-2]